jgi:hypothetical protein
MPQARLIRHRKRRCDDGMIIEMVPRGIAGGIAGAVARLEAAAEILPLLRQ